MSAAVASFQGPNRIVVIPVLKEVELLGVVNAERPHHPGLRVLLVGEYRDLRLVWSALPESPLR